MAFIQKQHTLPNAMRTIKKGIWLSVVERTEWIFTSAKHFKSSIKPIHYAQGLHRCY